VFLHVYAACERNGGLRYDLRRKVATAGQDAGFIFMERIEFPRFSAVLVVKILQLIDVRFAA